MNRTIYVVSADAEVGPRVVSLLLESRVGAAVLFRTGSECLRALERAGGNGDVTVIIDGVQTDFAPLNLADGVRSRLPHANIVFAITPANEQTIQRAMLVGARAVVERTRVWEELVPTLSRVAIATPKRGNAGLGEASAGSSQGACLVVTGACGGAGRSTVSTLLGWASGDGGTDTALVDFDLQFGDLAFLHDAPEQPTLVDMVAGLANGTSETRSFGRQIRENLTLYSPSPQPEHAEIVAPKIRQVLQELKAQHQLVVVNTGAFWTLFHAEMLDAADLCLLVLGQSAAAIRATVQATGLCRKLGVPDARIAYLMNRVVPRRIIAPIDAAVAFDVPEVLSLPDGGAEVSTFLDAGDVAGLRDSRNVLPPAIDAVLGSLRPVLGLATPEAPVPAMKRWPWRR